MVSGMGADRTSKKKRLRRLLFSVVVFLVGVELVLQVAHVAAANLRTPASLPHPGAPVILCVGDSHTYGVKLAAEDSYPGQLQELFNQGGIPVNVINAGIPGQNSSELRRHLPALLEQYGPRIVLVLVSANNDWNRKDIVMSDLADGAIADGPRAWMLKLGYGLEGSLRVVRLCRYLWKETLRQAGPLERGVDREGRVHFHNTRLGSDDWASLAELLDRGQRDLVAIIDLARRAGAEPVILNYPPQPFAPMTVANHIIEDAARIRGAILVDVAGEIRSRFWRSDDQVDWEMRDRLFLKDRDETHLAGPGYAVVAQKIYETIVARDLLRGR